MADAPALTVELLASTTGPAFGFTALVLDSASDGQLDEEGLAGLDQWVDISDDVRSVAITRGSRDRDSDSFRSGSCMVALDNRDRQFDPSNDGADLAGNIIPGRRLRVIADANGTPRTLFTGIVEAWQVTWSQPFESETVAACFDGFAQLANITLADVTPTGAGEDTGARVTRVLDLPEVDWPAADRAVGAGSLTTADYVGGGNAAAYLQQVGASEPGALFITVDGKVKFRGRTDAPTATAATLTDDIGDTASIAYESATLTSDSDALRNQVVVTGDGHADVVVDDASSQTAFGVRTLTRTSLLDNITDATTLAATLLGRYKDPELRFDSVSVLLPRLSAARQDDLLSLELDDVVSIVRNPPGDGTPATIEQVGRIDALAWTMAPGNMWTCGVHLSSASNQIFFVLDSAEFGELDDDRLA